MNRARARAEASPEIANSSGQKDRGDGPVSTSFLGNTDQPGLVICANSWIKLACAAWIPYRSLADQTAFSTDRSDEWPQ
jgi:hypothetical protein